MKKSVGAAEAARMLEREFARFKPEACKTCTAPLPFWGPGVDSGSGYWYVKMLPTCPHQCAQVISRLWAEITMEFEIVRSGSESGRSRFQGAVMPPLSPAPRRGQFKKMPR